MRRVELLAERGSDSEGAALPDNKDRVHRYLCPECSRVTAVAARHVGHVRYVVDCAHPGCAGEALREDGAPVRVDEHVRGGGEVHASFFRPLEADVSAREPSGGTTSSPRGYRRLYSC